MFKINKKEHHMRSFPSDIRGLILDFLVDKGAVKQAKKRFVSALNDYSNEYNIKHNINTIKPRCKSFRDYFYYWDIFNSLNIILDDDPYQLKSKNKYRIYMIIPTEKPTFNVTYQDGVITKTYGSYYDSDCDTEDELEDFFKEF